MQIVWIHDREQWTAQLLAMPLSHFLQTWEWGDFKAQTTGWKPERCFYLDDNGDVVAAASILTRRIGPLRVMYIPKGPIFKTFDSTIVQSVLDHLQKLARQRIAIWLKIDPDIVIGTGLPPEAPSADNHPDEPDLTGQQFQSLLEANKWHFSGDQVQFRNTMILDLTQSEDEIFAGMNQSTRRKIRQSEKKDVVIRPTMADNDLKILYNIYAVTGERQGFTVRPWEYYQTLWQTFIKANFAHILVAEYDGQILGGVILFHFGQRVWYFNGMSSNEHRDRQPNYGLQWAALQWAKAQGYLIYDWWGAPNHFQEDDPMWGVFRFKEGFGSQIVRTLGAWDYVPYPPLNWLYARAVPRIIGWLRRRNRPQFPLFQD
jgi:lipid II:glycine glycyltransferase (peptidoglycan interpeptide bridge formation enzyme)